ncbi:MAG: hypothetical protein JW869_01525 [Candidatus Omnitrophica bacterium]|nr:hypothetical protein [Candidatus Omnitrophota bacterium]
MAKFLACALIAAACVFSQVPTASAQDPQALMVEIYGGMADIIESNMNDPDRCISEIRAFGAKHRSAIDRITEVSQGNREQAMQEEYSYEDVDMGEIQDAMEEMAKSKGFQEMNRFMEATQNFSMQNGDYAEELGSAIEEVFPQPEETY